MDAAAFTGFIKGLTLEEVNRMKSHIQQADKVSWATEEKKLLAPYINLKK